MDSLNSFDKTDRIYSLAATNGLIRFWRSEVKVTAGRLSLSNPVNTISHELRAGSMKLTGNNHWSLLMTCLDVGGQSSRSQLGSSTWC